MADIAIFRINYKSDFILTLQSDAGWATPFCIKFWTGIPSLAYFAGWDGSTYTHCAPVEGDPTKLSVQFDDHHLPIGDLKFQIGYHFTVADFPTTVEDEVINQAAVIIDNDGTSMQVMLDFNGETAPEIMFALPAYAAEQARQEAEAERERVFAEKVQEVDTAIAGAENVNATLNGNTLTVTDRQGVSHSVNTKGAKGDTGATGPQGPKGDTGATGPQGPKGDKFTYSDFTPAEIAELQRPATVAAATANTAAASANEAARNANEKAALANQAAQDAAAEIDKIEDIIGDLGTILDNINGEVI
jgi:hypothetical protein